jgi:hypothetical protein
MPADDEMTIAERRKYLRLLQPRYQKAGRRERSRMLDEMEKVTRLHRKSLTRLMHQDLARRPRRRQRGRSYGHQLDLALRIIAESVDYVCAERLRPNLVWLAQHLAHHGELELGPDLLAQLARISTSTLRRRLQRIAQDEPRLPRRRPQPPNRSLRDVPIRRIPWNEPQPGHFEVDLVHHCGLSASGQYVHTLQMVDVATGWSERAATLGRSYLAVQDAFERILARLPIPVLEVHPDNGSEFFNDHLRRFWQDRFQDAQLSRSRPLQRNVNRFVEQKNSTLVRAYFGDQRLDTVRQTNLLNRLYDRMWLYYNFFQPVMRLEQKTIFPSAAGPARICRKFDQPQTPLDRLCATQILSPALKAQLRALRRATNPRQLRQEIYRLIESLLRLPCARPNGTQDVRATLIPHPIAQKGEARPVTLSFDRTVTAR